MKALDWYVSLQGTDDHCGLSQDKACRDMHYVINNIKDGYVIYIDAVGTDRHPINICATKYIAVSFSLAGLNGQPVDRGKNIILMVTSKLYKIIHDMYNDNADDTNVYNAPSQFPYSSQNHSSQTNVNVGSKMHLARMGNSAS